MKTDKSKYLGTWSKLAKNHTKELNKATKKGLLEMEKITPKTD